MELDSYADDVIMRAKNKRKRRKRPMSLAFNGKTSNFLQKRAQISNCHSFYDKDSHSQEPSDISRGIFAIVTAISAFT